MLEVVTCRFESPALQECCQISRVPVSIYPLMIADDKRDFDTDMAEAWEGKHIKGQQKHCD